MVKAKGRWILTEEGRAAFKKSPEAEEFYKEALRLYHECKKRQVGFEEPEAARPDEREGKR